MSSIKLFRTDMDLEDRGAPIEIATGVIVTVRSAMSKKVREWELARYRKNRSIYAGGGALTVAQMDLDEIDKAAEVVVTGWTGLTDDDEVTPIEWSVATAKKLFKEAPAFRRAILSASNEMENFRRREVEVVAKNSVTPSKQDGDTGASQI